MINNYKKLIFITTIKSWLFLELVLFCIEKLMSIIDIESNATKDFWDGVSELYGENEMTKHESDYEMEIVLSNIKNNYNILACFGVADGSRDPCMIIDYMCKNGYKIGKLIINDISSEMTKITAKRAESFIRDTSTHELCEIPEIEIFNSPLEKLLTTKKSSIDDDITIIIGVYSSLFLYEGLELYMKNKEIIGNTFSVFPIYYLEDKSIIKGDYITFDIDNYIDICKSTDILSWCKKSDFLGYSISTDKNFVSHYFNPGALSKLIADVFVDTTIKTDIGYGSSSRYIVHTIKNNKGSGNKVFITMLNNVLGNITWQNQKKALSKLKEIFV